MACNNCSKFDELFEKLEEVVSHGQLFEKLEERVGELQLEMRDMETFSGARTDTLQAVQTDVAYVLANSIPAKFEKLDGRMDKLEEQVKKLELTVVGDLLKTADRFAEHSRALLGVTEKLDRVDRDLKRFLDICHARTDLLSSDDDEQPTTSGSAASTGTA